MNEHINEEGLCYCGSLDCIGHLRVISDKLTADLVKSQALAESYKAKRDAIVTFIQNSIDSGDWEQTELAEPFWEELAEIADLNLRRTKEVEFKITISYYGSVTVPYDCDVESDLEVEGVPNNLELSYKGETLDDQSCNWDEQEITEY